MAARALTFDITTTDAQTLSELSKIQKKLQQTGDVAETTGKRTKSSGQQLSNFFKTVAVAAVGREVLSEANQSQQVAARTAAVIKSTGNAAGISAKQQDAYVQSLSKTAAIDDEVIAGGANLLRTFKDVKGDAFQPALAAAVDLSAALGTDLQSAVLQVGKALQDPIKGITALRRAGVSFSDQQREQIKVMVEAGDKVGAQRVILKELQSEFGGSAKAMATDSARVKVALQNTAESVGKSILPAVGVVSGLAEEFSNLPTPVQTGALALGALTVVVNKLEGRLGEGGLLGILGSDVGELGTFNTAMGAAAAGGAAFGITLDQLNKSVQFHGDVQGLGKDLADLASGAASPGDAVKELGGSIDELAHHVELLADDSIGKRLDGLRHGLKGLAKIAETKQAASDMKALDTALASLAANDPGAAATAVSELGKALEAQGVPISDLIAQLPQYSNALARAQRDNEHGATAAKGNADANVELAGRLRAVGDAQADNAEKTFNATRALRDANEAVVTDVADLATAKAAAKGDSDEYRAAVKAEATDLADLADAQAAVGDAQRAAADARSALNQEERDAAERIDALADATRKAAQTERDATLALHEAQAENRKVLADPRSSALDKEKASVGLADATDSELQARKDNAKAIADENAAKAAGIEGDKQVIAAKQRVEDATKAIGNAEENVRQKQAQVAADGQAKSKILADAADQVRAAQTKVTDALLDQADKYRDLVTAQQGPYAGLVAYRQKLADIAADLQTGGPLQTDLATFLAGVTQALQLDVGVVPNGSAAHTSSGGQGGGTGVVGIGTPASAPATTTGGGGGGGILANSITLNLVSTGTPRQVQRSQAAAAKKSLDELWRGAR